MTIKKLLWGLLAAAIIVSHGPEVGALGGQLVNGVESAASSFVNYIHIGTAPAPAPSSSPAPAPATPAGGQ